MICEINVVNLPAAFASGASLIIISGDSSLALVRTATLIDCIESYADAQLSTLMSEAKWHQPCKDCEL